MKEYKLLLNGAAHKKLLSHLQPMEDHTCEEAAFLFCDVKRLGEAVCFATKDSWLLPPAAFSSRSEYYLELIDKTRASLIKRAHDLKTCLVEVHSHPLQKEAEFSWSDLRGFSEFVPHVRWRLKGLPYVAVVCSPHSFDSLVWEDGEHPSGICLLSVDGVDLEPTGNTYSSFKVAP